MRKNGNNACTCFKKQFLKKLFSKRDSKMKNNQAVP